MVHVLVEIACGKNLAECREVNETNNAATCLSCFGHLARYSLELPSLDLDSFTPQGGETVISHSQSTLGE